MSHIRTRAIAVSIVIGLAAALALVGCSASSSPSTARTQSPAATSAAPSEPATPTPAVEAGPAFSTVQGATSYVQGGNNPAALAKCTAIISTGPFEWKHAAAISYGQAMDLNTAMGNQESKTEQLAKYDPNVETTMCASVNPNLLPANQLDVFVVSDDDKLIELGLLQQ